MIREDALMILHLPKDATREQIEQSYTQLRQLYHPNCYGTPHEFSQLQLEEVLCRELSSPYYKEPEGVQYQNFPQVGYEYAFTRYALVCQAYDYLTSPKNQNQYGVDPNTPYGYDTLHYGLTVAKLRYQASLILTYAMIPVIIGYLLTGLIGAMINRDGNFFSVVSSILLVGYFVLQGIAWLSTPLDMLLLIPKRILAGMKVGAETESWLLKPLAILFKGALYGIGGALALVFFPAFAALDREDRYRPWIKNHKKAHAAAHELYCKVQQNIADLPAAPINDDMYYVSLVLQEAAKEYQAAKKGLENTLAACDLDVEKAGKRFNMEVKFIDWDIDGAEDDFRKALDERSQRIQEGETQYQKASRLFGDLLRRTGAYAEDYIDE